MNQTKVSFSWENKPGVSKVMITEQQQNCVDEGCDNKQVLSPKLPPPPCPAAGSRSFSSTSSLNHHDIQIPLPPCAFQGPPPPSRSSSRKGLVMMNMKQHQDQDPFLVAFKECTKTTTCRNVGGNRKLAKNNYKGIFNFSSCKRSCSVRDDNLIRISQLPHKKDGDM